jgi:methenyltetrahydrofolate cyclohydrolase
MLDTKSVREFADELASKSPAPGGGSVAALSASIASALSSMVFNLTIGKKIYNTYNEEDKNKVNISQNDSEIAKDEFLKLMNDDTEAFLKLMKTFKLPKATDEEKRNRSEKIQEGYKGALEVPFNVAEKAFDMYKYIYTAVELGNKNAISDAGVAALMLQAAIESAILNVKINLTSIKDKDYKDKISCKSEQFVNEGRKKRDEILALVNEAI